MTAKSKTGIQQIAEGAWAMVTSAIGPEGGGPNAGIIQAGHEVILVDTLISLTPARELLAAIKELTGQSPTFVINTHPHADHVNGNQVFAPPAKIIAHENVREFLVREGRAIIDRFLQGRPAYAEDLKDARIVPPDIAFRDSLELDFGGRTVKIVHPGKAHTLGDSFVYLPESKVLFAGDLLFNHIIPPITGSSTGWIEAIEQLEKLDIETVVPGHGFVGKKQDLVDMKKFIIDLRQQVRTSYERKLTGEQALAGLKLDAYRDWPHPERLKVDVDQLYREFAAGA